MKKLILLFAVLSVSVFVHACGQAQEGAARKPLDVGAEPAEAEFIEQDSFNIPYWLGIGVTSRVLVRLSAYDGMAPVGDDVLAKISGMAESGDREALLTAGDSLADGNLYDASSFAYVAHRLGMLREVIWVVPIFLRVDQEYLDSLKRFLAGIYPEAEEEINGLTLEGVQATGTINGVPVRLVGLQDLEYTDGPVLLDIDTSFFGTLYRDEKDTGSLPFVAGMFKLLKEAGLASDAISISASGEDGRTPLKFRSFARYLERLLMEPDLVESEAPELWSERAAAWRMEQKDPETAIPLYKKLIEQYPGDAASRYDLADVYFRLGELEACAAQLESAAGIDPGYAVAFGFYRDRIAEAGEPGTAALFFARRPQPES